MPSVKTNVHRPGFTIVEILVVIGIIALLIGILLPALSGVQKRSKKMTELNKIRNIGAAWSMYANSNADAALPGYLDHETEVNGSNVQDLWRVRFEYPIPPAPNASRQIPQDIAAPWTWRLLKYLDYNYDLVWGYRNQPYDSETLIQEAALVASEPAFGYNGYYVGGWWDVQSINTPDGGGQIVRARHRFSEAKLANGDPANVVVRTLPSIARPSELVVFCSSAWFQGPGLFRRQDDDRAGSHLVTPPTLANVPQWRNPLGAHNTSGGSGPGGGGPGNQNSAVTTVNDRGDVYSIEAFATRAFAPIGRFNGLAAVLYADGSTDAQTPAALSNQAKWIDRAVTPNYTHTPN